MLDDNFFADFFGKFMGTPESYKEKLDDYWQHGNVKQYYELLNRCKEQYRVLRNTRGRHRVERK